MPNTVTITTMGNRNIDIGAFTEFDVFDFYLEPEPEPGECICVSFPL